MDIMFGQAMTKDGNNLKMRCGNKLLDDGMGII